MFCFSVFNVSDVVEYEQIVIDITRIAAITYTSEPIIWYQTFAKFLGVDEDLLPVGGDTLKDDSQVFWMDMKLEYPGKLKITAPRPPESDICTGVLAYCFGYHINCFFN